mmetsp:Transcript_60381/g.143928  ORF Transcript_60381/g.143928 Transcript_60381/m.143928 type:complete len:501 (-) Transcript_60381:71-1573(-)
MAESTSPKKVRSSTVQIVSEGMPTDSLTSKRSSTLGFVLEGTSNGSGSSKIAKGRYIPGSNIPKPANFDGNGILAIVMHPLSVLLLLLPFGIAAKVYNWGDTYVFFLNFLAMVPLAKILGDATEELAVGLKNDMLAGLLNATFGNAVEMVIMIQTLRKGLFSVVKATLLGSILSNTLLVLGMSFFFGGIMGAKKRKKALSEVKYSTKAGVRGSAMARGDPDSPSKPGAEEEMEDTTGFVAEKVQNFSVLNALVNISMLLMSCLALSLVTVFQAITNEEGISVIEGKVVPISRVCSILIVSAYFAYLVFQLITHREALAEDEGGDDEDDEEEEHISVGAATLLLFVSTAIVAVCSELLVGALEGVTGDGGSDGGFRIKMSEHFVGIILLPIVGNACEHAAAVRFAIADKPGLSIGIAIGSSTQISLFVVPMSVLIGWFLNKDMDLNFGTLNTTVMTISIIVVLSMVVDGSSNWLQGYLLMVAYLVVGVLYWNLPNDLPAME